MKLAVIGGGSTYTPELADGIGRLLPSVEELVLVDPDPGRLANSAYHLIHPVMVAGIIVTAAADEKVLSDLDIAANTASAWMILGGPALFLLGHAAFKYVVWGYLSWPRLAGIAALALACALTFQAALGILTLLEQAPLGLALMHQAMAMIVLTVAVLHAQGMTAPELTRAARPSPDPADRVGAVARR